MANISFDSANKAKFDKWSENYDQHKMSSWFKHTQKLAIKQLSLSKDSKVLDVGCGTGFATLYLGSILTDGQACGIDLSEGMIKKAKEKIPGELETKVEFRQSGSDNIPYEDGKFDGIICTNSFHHYQNPLKSLSEMKRVLKPGGQLVILDTARNLSLYTWLWDRYLRIFEKGHIRYYTTKELKELLVQSKFSNIELKVCQNEVMKHGKFLASIMLWTAKK